MPQELTPAQRELRRAIGRLGGLTGQRNTQPARLAHLVQCGAEVDAAGQIVEGPATAKARKLMTARARLARAQKAVAREQARAKAKAGQGT